MRSELHFEKHHNLSSTFRLLNKRQRLWKLSRSSALNVSSWFIPFRFNKTLCKLETLKRLRENVSCMTNEQSKALVRLQVYRCVLVCGTWSWTGSLINLSVRVWKADDIPCSSMTCACTWFFSSLPPPTAVFALLKKKKKRMRELLLLNEFCRLKTSSALSTVTSGANQCTWIKI